jgi:hypothetical protein
VISADVVDRQFRDAGNATVERVDDSHYRVVVGATSPTEQGAMRLLADRRRLKATLSLTYRPPSGDAVTIERRVTLRAKPR